MTNLIKFPKKPRKGVEEQYQAFMKAQKARKVDFMLVIVLTMVLIALVASILNHYHFGG